MSDAPRLPLADLRVLELATVVAGPGCGRYLADFGADVIKIERPGAGDSTRSLGWRDPTDGTTFWWKLLGRNKRCIELDLKDEAGRERFLALVATADVVIENFRPGKLEALGLGPDVLLAAKPDLVVTRISGFGQDGPYAQRPGFATLAEAMSGFAAINGTDDSGPTLPPIALTDEVTALTAAFATLVARHSGVGQVVDVNLLESMFQVMGPLLSVHAATGYVQPRMGSELPYSVPRNTYRCGDGRWVAVSASAESVGPRVMELVGLDPVELATFEARVAARDRINAALGEWVAARTADEVLAGFAAVDAAVALVFDAADIATDPHFAARGTLVELGGTTMQGLVAHLSATPGRLAWSGRAPGADTAEVLAELDDR
ncbi:MAG: CoA transferase [Acidimicrobiia bacterium]|nr:CoA transferase [Acidimicrobiia bacterium]